MKTRTNIAKQLSNSTVSVPINLKLAVLEKHPECKKSYSITNKRTGQKGMRFVFADKSQTTVYFAQGGEKC